MAIHQTSGFRAGYALVTMMRWSGVILVGSCVLSACSFGHAVKRATVDRRGDQRSSELQMTGGSRTTFFDQPAPIEAPTGPNRAPPGPSTPTAAPRPGS